MAVIQGKLGRTVLAVEDDAERMVGKCDASTVLLREDGTAWRDGLLVHRFSPGAEEPATFITFTDVTGERVKVR